MCLQPGVHTRPGWICHCELQLPVWADDKHAANSDWYALFIFFVGVKHVKLNRKFPDAGGIRLCWNTSFIDSQTCRHPQ